MEMEFIQLNTGVPVEVKITAAGDHSAEEMRSLREWLLQEQELRGRVTLDEAAPEPGTMGALSEVLTVTLAPGGFGTVFAGAFIAWIRHRTSNADYRLIRRDGSVIEVSAKHVRGLDGEALQTQVAELLGALDDTGEGAGGGGVAVGPAS